MKVLVTGASGFIGSRLLEHLPNEGAFEVSGLAHSNPAPGLRALDLTDESSVAGFLRELKPDAVVHAAAMGDPDKCETNPEAARRVNVDATRHVAEACAGLGARLVYFSTDLVFDGERGMYVETDATRPINAYSRTKVESERLVLERCPGAAIVRVSLVYGRVRTGRPTFMDWLRERLARGETVRAFQDQFRSPTSCAQLPAVIAGLLRRPEARGVFHWSGGQRASRYDYALELCRVFGFPERLVEPSRMDEVAAKAMRPRDASLDSRKLSGLLGIPLLSLKQGLEAVRDELARAA
ncbi:MAG: dTDP-4-dehydrorhamnose reductase [Proteobacteria bacterium]|nr:dTDP-4-dehydrorhamnose reductase [Pseudomonadota bacterium]